MKSRYTAIFLLGLATGAWSAAANGTAGFQFLKTHMGARQAGMAGAMVAIAPDVNALHYNPAGIAAITQRTGSFSYLKHLLDFNSGYVTYVQPQVGPGNIGAAITYIDYGNFDKRDQNNQDLGDFRAGSIAFTGAYAMQPLRNLYAGVALNYIRATIDSYASDAVAVDGGVIYNFPAQKLSLAASFANTGKVLSSFITEKDPLPAVVRFGLCKGLAHLPLMVSLQLYKYSDEEWHGALGGEFTLTENVFLRLGYDQSGRDLQVDASGDRFAGAALGLGAIWRDFQVDYAYSSMGALGALNRFTLSGSF
jgi:hypothetical protein